MKKPFLIALALVAAPFAAQAETINIYGWQNHSWEFVDDNGTNTDRIQSNAGNIGFAASVDTGLDGIHVNLQCEQFTYYNQLGGGTGWCNRNSKIGLSHPDVGEIMLATWLLPYNEGVAQWVDPFYDAGQTRILASWDQLVPALSFITQELSIIKQMLGDFQVQILCIREHGILASTGAKRISSSTGRQIGTVLSSASPGRQEIRMRLKLNMDQGNLIR